MEIIVRIANQGALEEREYTNQQTGMTEKFASMPFVLQHGTDTIHAEMIQEQARKQGVLDPNYYYLATLNFKAQPVKTKDGGEFVKNNVTLTKIALL